MTHWQLLVSLLETYLICAIPFGLVISRFVLKKDLRKIGSGSTGATNVLRAGSKLAAAATLALDALKPIAAWWIAERYFGAHGNLKLIVAALAVVAHCYPVYTGFKGGKGVATAWGTMWLFDPRLALSAIGLWAAVLALAKKSSLSAIVAALAAPLLALRFTDRADMAWLYAGIVVLVLFRHKSNMQRLLAGTEDDVEFRKKKK